VSLCVTILGCGASGGVPRLGYGWGACDPSNPKNRRRRCSILVAQKAADGGTTQVLIDTSPDLREQLLEIGVTSLDAILLTHRHADHTHGIDDLRPLVIKAKRRMDLYMDAATSEVIRYRFGYIFDTPPNSFYPPILDEKRLIGGTACRIGGAGGAIEFLPFELEHGDIDALGFRFGNIAYSPDLKAIPEASRGFLEDLDLWIVDALRYMPHPSHFCLAESLDWIAKLRPRRAILTNLHGDLDFERLRHELPAHVEPAFDGMRIET
jgi:phosphoribosyl 1,2-cyclic phosphate phosphodiesterase